MPSPTKKTRSSKKSRSARCKPSAQNKKAAPPTAGEWFEKLLAVQKRLRAPNGCPWDREQTHATLRTYLLEETYEVLDALDSGNDAKFSSSR